MTTSSSRASLAPSAPIVQRIVQPFQRFAAAESSSGILLLVCTVAALLWANSAWSAGYAHLWERPFSVGGLTLSLHHWINDGLMAVFFFVVGLEIKREILVGELASVRRAALPLLAAFGGVLVPATIYTALNAGTIGASGWGIPMATDIAFALGALALLGSRVPVGLKVFLSALAIVDDIAAVLVIAVFYTEALSLTAVGAAAAIVVLLLGSNRAGLRHPGVYALLGVALWFALLQSGIHATIAGVLVALTIPARTRIDAEEFLVRSRAILDDFQGAGRLDEHVLSNSRQQEAIHQLEEVCEAAQAPLLKLEDKLHLLVAFGIMPLFAFANAGLDLRGDVGAAIGTPITLGVFFGLVLGKPIGITLFSWIAVRSGLAERPDGVTWRHLHGASWLGGIGFTMSLFIADLAFTGNGRLTAAKIGILAASTVAGSIGLAILWRVSPGRAEGNGRIGGGTR